MLEPVVVLLMVSWVVVRVITAFAAVPSRVLRAREGMLMLTKPLLVRLPRVAESPDWMLKVAPGLLVRVPVTVRVLAVGVKLLEARKPELVMLPATRVEALPSQSWPVEEMETLPTVRVWPLRSWREPSTVARLARA